jgi:hypothetical protein
MAEPTATTAAATAATTAGFTIFGYLAGLHPDLVIAGLVGGIAAILAMETMPARQRIESVLVAIVTSGLCGPILVFAAPRIFPDVLGGIDTGALRLAVGFVLGVLAYGVLVPALIRRVGRELGGRK